MMINGSIMTKSFIQPKSLHSLQMAIPMNPAVVVDQAFCFFCPIYAGCAIMYFALFYQAMLISSTNLER